MFGIQLQLFLLVKVLLMAAGMPQKKCMLQGLASQSMLPVILAIRMKALLSYLLEMTGKTSVQLHSNQQTML